MDIPPFEGDPDEIADNTSTTATLDTGGSAFGMVNTPGDVDWYRFTLSAGDWVTFTVDGDARGDVTASGTAIADHNGLTPAHAAALSGHFDILFALIKRFISNPQHCGSAIQLSATPHAA